MNPSTKLITACLLLIALNACQTTAVEPLPAPEPAPEPIIEVAPPPVETIVVEPPPVDQNKLDYLTAVEQLMLGQIGVTAELEKISLAAPELEFIFTNLGLAYFKQQNYQQAKSSFERAISQNKNDVVAYNHLGILNRMRGEFEQSRQNYEKAISIDQEYAPAYLNLGILFDIYIQDIKQALAQYKKYQLLTNDEDKTVAGWIADIERRIKSG